MDLSDVGNMGMSVDIDSGVTGAVTHPWSFVHSSQLPHQWSPLMHFNYAYNMLRLRNQDILTYIKKSVRLNMQTQVYILVDMVHHMLGQVSAPAPMAMAMPLPLPLRLPSPVPFVPQNANSTNATPEVVDEEARHRQTVSKVNV